jgi:hypothetical protein
LWRSRRRLHRRRRRHLQDDVDRAAIAGADGEDLRRVWGESGFFHPQAIASGHEAAEQERAARVGVGSPIDLGVEVGDDGSPVRGAPVLSLTVPPIVTRVPWASRVSRQVIRPTAACASRWRRFIR